MVKIPEMYDNPIYLEPTLPFTGFLYDLPDVRPPRISGRQKVSCGHPPSLFARGLNCRKRHFGFLQKTFEVQRTFDIQKISSHIRLRSCF